MGDIQPGINSSSSDIVGGVQVQETINGKLSPLSDLRPVFDLANIFSDHERLDQNHNGYLSKPEIKFGTSSENRSTEVSVSLAALQAHHGGIRQLHDDGANQKKGFSQADINAFIHVAKLESIRRIANTPDVFNSFDLNGDGKVSKGELDGALKHMKDSPAKEAVKEMLSNFDIMSQHSDGITAGKATEYANKNISQSEKRLLNDFVQSAQLAQSNIENTNSQVYAGKDPVEAISPYAVKQGQVGDCWLLSALSSMAKANPDFLANMVKPDGNGSYKVSFPFQLNGQPLEVKVKEPTKAELAAYGGTVENGKWGAIIEKAVAELFQKVPSLKETLTGTKATPSMSAQDSLNGSREPAGLTLLSGAAERKRLADLSDEQLKAELQKPVAMTATSPGTWPHAENNKPGKLASTAETMGWSGGKGDDRPLDDFKPDADLRPPKHHDIFPPKPGDTPKQPKDDWDDSEEDGERQLYPSHAFAVIAYDAAKQTVEVRNPWGHGELVSEQGAPLDGVDDGVMHLTINQFRQHFSQLHQAKK